LKLLGGGVLDLSNEFNVDILDVAGHLEADGRLFVVSKLKTRELLSEGRSVNVLLSSQVDTSVLQLVEASFAAVNPNTGAHDNLGFLADQDGLFNHEEFALKLVGLLLSSELSQLGEIPVLENSLGRLLVGSVGQEN